MKEYRILTHQFWEFKGEKIKSQQILKKPHQMSFKCCQAK